MSIGDNIKKIRILKNLKQSEVAELSNVSRVAIGNYERGDRTPNIEILKKISKGLDTDLDIILHWTKILDSDPDVIVFLERIFNSREEFDEKISSLVSLNPNSAEFLSFLICTTNDKTPYIKIADILQLTDTQLYNWILYKILINEFNFDDFNMPIMDHNTIMSVMGKLEKQNIDDLLINGLSKLNKSIIIKFYNEIKVDRYIEISKKEIEEWKNNDPTHKLFHELNSLLSKLYNNDTVNLYVNKLMSIKTILNILKVDFEILDIDNKPSILVFGNNFKYNLSIDEFINFTDKVYWSIEREIDYLKHLYD